MSLATDHALATIASILGPLGRAREANHPEPAGADTPAAAPDQPAAAPKNTIEAEGYSKTGPGPMAALRFKWTVRHGDDGYYVDETVGAGSVPVVNGPMSGEAAIAFVDDRAREAQERFQALRNEMSGRGPAAPTLASGAAEK